MPAARRWRSFHANGSDFHAGQKNFTHTRPIALSKQIQPLQREADSFAALVLGIAHDQCDRAARSALFGEGMALKLEVACGLASFRGEVALRREGIGAARFNSGSLELGF